MILVTGAAGAIGQRLVQKLVAVYGDNSVTTITREPFDIPGALNRVHDLSNPLDESILDIGFNIDGIVHLAAVHNVGDSLRRPEYYYQQNTAMTNNVLGYAIRRKVRWFQFASTGMVYGQGNEYVPSKESDLIEPGNPYALSKLLCENLISSICKHHNIYHGIFRIFNVVTPVREDDIVRSRFLIPSICQAAKKGQSYDMFVNNKSKSETLIRDYIHIDDVVESLYWGIEYLKKHSPDLPYPSTRGQLDFFDQHDPIVVNVCTGRPTSVLEVIEWAQQVTKKKIPITISEPAHWEPYFVGNPHTLRTLLDCRPKYSVVDMIDQQWRLLNE